MRPPKGIRRANRSEWMRQGLHAKSDQIIDALADQGTIVDVDAVQRVRVELLKEQSSAQPERPLKKPDKRKARAQKIPEKRPQRR